MVTLIINMVLFFLVMFVLVPGVMIVAMLMRDQIHYHRKHDERHKALAGKSAG